MADDRKRFVAICPDCDDARDLDFMPEPGFGWPHCSDCGESMNVFVRQKKASARG